MQHWWGAPPVLVRRGLGHLYQGSLPPTQVPLTPGADFYGLQCNEILPPAAPLVSPWLILLIASCYVSGGILLRSVARAVNWEVCAEVHQALI